MPIDIATKSKDEKQSKTPSSAKPVTTDNDSKQKFSQERPMVKKFQWQADLAKVLDPYKANRTSSQQLVGMTFCTCIQIIYLTFSFCCYNC